MEIIKGQREATSSGEQTAGTAVYAGRCLLASVLVITDGTNDAKLIIYNHASTTSGTVVFEMTVKGADHYGGMVFVHPKRMTTGIYASGSGSCLLYTSPSPRDRS